MTTPAKVFMFTFNREHRQTHVQLIRDKKVQEARVGKRDNQHYNNRQFFMADEIFCLLEIREHLGSRSGPNPQISSHFQQCILRILNYSQLYLCIVFIFPYALF